MLVVAQLLGGVSAAAVTVLTVLVITDLTTGTGRFNLVRGSVGTVIAVAASVSTTASGFIFQTFGHWAGFLTAALVAAAFAAKSLLDHLVGGRRSGQFPLLVPLALNVRDGIRCRTAAFAHMKNPPM